MVDRRVDVPHVRDREAAADGAGRSDGDVDGPGVSDGAAMKLVGLNATPTLVDIHRDIAEHEIVIECLDALTNTARLLLGKALEKLIPSATVMLFPSGMAKPSKRTRSALIATSPCKATSPSIATNLTPRVLITISSK